MNQVKIFGGGLFARLFCANLIRVMRSKSDNLKANKRRLLGWIKAIDQAIQEIALTGTASATISAGGGSKSYTRLDIDKLRTLRREYAGRVAQINRTLAGIVPGGIRHVMTVRC